MLLLQLLPRAVVVSRCSLSVRRNASAAARAPSSAYVHLPFCRKRCHYCDFPVVALGTSTAPPLDPDDDDPRISRYVRLLLREIEATPKFDADNAMPLETVFFGGGTPSLVPPRLVASILDALRAKFGVTDDAEVSMEMDPGTFDAGKLAELVALGVNRVSLGVQAFQEELLRACGRAHGLQEVYEAIRTVRSCPGLENWSADLISSLPQQTEEMWEHSLRCIVDEQPAHVSVYDLQVEKGTKFAQLYTPGQFPLPSESESAKFYRMASAVLGGAGYEHYEISSYCRSGFECKHNSTYWLNRPFYGFGLGSASFVGRVRYSRPRKLREYADWVERLESGDVDQHGVNGSDDSSTTEAAMDAVMLGLRTAKGLDLQDLEASFGSALVLALCDSLKPFVESGHVVAMDSRRQPLPEASGSEPGPAFLRLSDPDGFLLSNELISIAFGAISP